MKKIYYEDGPDQIGVGPFTNQTWIRRGKENALPFDDKTADLLLKKPRFKELKETATGTVAGKKGE